MYRRGTFTYALHHRLLASDCELPFLVPAANGEPDIVLRLTTRVAPPASAEAWYRGPSLTIDRAANELLVTFEDATAFLVDERTISLVSAPDAYTRDDLAAYALGPVIAIALHLQGAVLLHASSVVVRSKAIVFAGASGSGKSTTAAILHRQGYAVLSDDVTELAGPPPYRALASLPAMRLWPDAVHALFGADAVFPDRAPSWEKKLVTIDPAPAAEVAAVLFLDPREPTPRLTRLAPREGWQRLMSNVYTAPLPGEEMAARIFETSTALAETIPMYAFAPPPVDEAESLGAFLEREL